MTPKSIKLTVAPIARVHRWQHFDTWSHRRIPQEQELARLVYDKDTGEFLNYWQLIKNTKHQELWTTSAANKFGRLAQGVGTRIPKDKATNTVIFIQKEQVPKDRIKKTWHTEALIVTSNPTKKKSTGQDSLQEETP